MIISMEIALQWMPQNTFDDKSTLVLVMVYCKQGLKNDWEMGRDDSLMLTTIHDDAFNMQNITPPQLKRWNYSNIPAGGT